MAPRPRAASGPALFTIPPHRSFLDALAVGLLARWGDSPLTLSEAVVLLPSRRACRSLRDAFLRASGGRPLLLPRMLPLGDLDAEELLFEPAPEASADGVGADLPPAMPALRRQLLLARLVARWAELREDGGSGAGTAADRALRLAGELGRLLDQIETEGLDLDGLAGLVPERYAAHWALTIDFLRIVTEHWPKLQTSEGAIGPAERRRRLLELQADAWAAAPPEHPVIAAGSTGSIPATARLLGVVARLPRGEVVLPGLDQEAPAHAWREILQDPCHPQHGLARLLEALGVGREAVKPWPGGEPRDDRGGPPTRTRLLEVALRPAASSADWRDLADDPYHAGAEAALAGLTRVDCPGPREEALVVALVLRRTLERPGATAALVTPDRGLARRVAAELARWGVAVDDSAGLPLGATAVGGLLRLSAEAAAEDLAPLPLLALLKHPLVAGGLSPGRFRALARRLELALLRGPRPAPGFDGLAAGLRRCGGDRELQSFLRRLRERLEPFAGLLSEPHCSLTELVRAQANALEALAATDEEDGAARLWRGEAGEAAAALIDELLEAGSSDAAAARAPLHAGGLRYPAFLEALLDERPVRPRYGRHPRLAILGPLEARLQQWDVVVLGGLNEGTWPAPVDSGPWLSRPMRRDIGLPLPERRIGLAAHDFVQLASAPDVYLTRASRVEGAPTVPSRWLLRLEAVLRGLDRQSVPLAAAVSWRHWAEALDRQDGAWDAPRRSGPPAPRPPLSARPRRLSVTGVETWVRDPYSLYAREILKLRPLDPIDAQPGAADRGILIHAALARFVERCRERWPRDPARLLLDIGAEVFQEVAHLPGLHGFWWPRFRRIAEWFVANEITRRRNLRASHCELRGELTLPGPAGPFLLTGTADRIDVLADGGLAIVDYKTGGVPSAAEVEAGFAPQLPLEAAMALAGAFPGVPAAPVRELAYWRLTGGDPPGEIRTQADPAALAAEARAGLEALIARFDDPGTPYPSRPYPDRAPAYGDYDHLARVKEWSTTAPDDGGLSG